MTKKFIVKDGFGKELGEVVYLKGKFEVNLFSKQDKERLEELINLLLKEGIYDLGEVILKKPIKPDNPLFLDEARNYLAKRGYALIEEN